MLFKKRLTLIIKYLYVCLGVKAHKNKNTKINNNETINFYFLGSTWLYGLC